MATETPPIPSFQEFLASQEQSDRIPSFAEFLAQQDKPPPPGSDFVRGIKTGAQQVPQLLHGVEAGIGAAGEATFGEGGIFSAIKKHGVEQYQKWSEKIGSEARDTDSFTFAYDEAKAGNFGALVDWMQYGLGYAGLQAVEMLATGGLGYVAGKATLQTVAKSAAEGLVAKEAARIVATAEGASLAGETLLKMATENVAGRLGQTAAIGAMAYGQEGGEIFGDLTQQATTEGKTLSGDQLAKAFGATIAAGTLEFVGDKFALDVMLRKSQIGKIAAGMPGLTGKVARGAVGAAALSPVEGATEYEQTLLEEAGKGNDPWSEATRKQAIDAAALGAIGGGAMGGVSGLISPHVPVIPQHPPGVAGAPPPGSAAPPPEQPEATIPAIVGVGNPAVSADDAIKAANKVVDSPKIVTAAALDAAIEGVKPEAPAPSVAALHRLAEAKGIPWDNDPTFMALTESVTGKQHLDMLTGPERAAVAARLAQEPARTPPPTGTGLIAPSAQVSVQPEAEEPGIYDVPRHELPEEDSQRLLDKAQVARGLVGQGEPGKRFQNDLGEWMGSSSTYPDFYGPLPVAALKNKDGSVKVSKRNRVIAALERIIEDAGKDTGPLVARVKAAIDQSSDVEGMVGATLGAQPETGQPAPPATDYGVFTEQELGDVVARLKRTMDALPKDRQHVIEAELEQIRLLQQQRQEQPQAPSEVPAKTEPEGLIAPTEPVKAEMPKAPAAPEAPAPPAGELFHGSETIGAGPIIGHDVNPVTAETEAPLFSKAAQEEQPEQGTLPETVPPAHIPEGNATEPSSINTLDEFKAAAERGILHKATGQRAKNAAAEMKARTPIGIGRANEYSENDIARFYADRRGVFSKDAEKIWSGSGGIENGWKVAYKEYRADLQAEATTIPGPGDTKVKETLKAKREEPLPGRSLQIGRGAHGQVKVVFPSKILADLFSFTGRMKRSIEGGKKFDVRANGEYLRKQLGLSDTANVGAISQDYKAVVMAAIKDLKEGETFTAPEYTERTTQDAQAARDAEDAKTAAIQAEKEKLKKKKAEKPAAMTDKEKAHLLIHGGRGAILPNVTPEQPVEPVKSDLEWTPYFKSIGQKINVNFQEDLYQAILAHEKKIPYSIDKEGNNGRTQFHQALTERIGIGLGFDVDIDQRGAEYLMEVLNAIMADAESIIESSLSNDKAIDDASWLIEEIRLALQNVEALSFELEQGGDITPEPVKQLPAPKPTAEPEPSSKDEIIRSAAAVKFTASQKDELQKRLKEKLRAAKSGGTVAEEPAPYGKPAFDARFLADTMQYGALYLNEDGKTTFADWSRQMVADLGEDVKPYLRATWSALQALPGNLTIRPNIAASLFEYGVKLYASTPDKAEFMAKLTKPFGAMSQPYAESVWAGLTAMASPVSEPALKSEDPGLTISDGVLGALEDYRVNGKALTREALFAMADQAYGGTQGEGAYTPKDAFDALELGVNRYIAKKQGTMFYNPALQQNVNPDIGAQTIIDRIRRRIMDAIPSQAGLRTDEMLEFQQFSTPPDLAFAMNWVANIGEFEITRRTGEIVQDIQIANDVVLEPSAGVGGIAVFAKLAGARVIVNELSDRRAALIQHLGFDRVLTENAEQIANLYPEDEPTPTVVVMNPPFSSTAGRMEGDRKSLNVLRHIEQAFSLLAYGGRLVVLIGDHNLGRDTNTSLHGPTSLSEGVIKGLADIPGVLRASIRISGEGYKKYGTTYGNRLLVYDKIKSTGIAPVVESVADIKDALGALAEVRNGRLHPTAASRPTKQPAAQPGGETLAGEGQPGTRPELPVPVPTAPVGPQRSGSDLSQEGVGGNVPTVPGGTGIRTGPGGGVSLPHRGGRRGTGGGRPATTGQPSGGGGVAPGPVPVTNDSGRESDTELPAERESDGIDLELGGGERTKHAGDLTDNLYEDYTPQKLKIEGAKPHPAKLVESAAMAATELPDPTYVPNLPQSIIEKGLLSLPQLEPIVYAGQAHAVILPNGERQGIALGYGTGFGKGRVISGIILDNFRQGRGKAIWLSEKHNLVKSAVRDWTDIGQSKDVFVPGDSDANKPLAKRKGDSILFTTYSTLRGGSGIDVQGKVSVAPEMVKGQPTGRMEPSRLEQLIAWAGPDFDGVIALDEAHNLANTEGAEGERGKAAGSLQAAVGVELKRRLPKARVVYVSATAAKGVDTIVYMERLGLWGEGTPFPKKSDFIAKMQLGGLGSMEVIARDLKTDGKYLSVSLDNSQVTYEQVEHELDRKQTDIYNELAKAWQIVLQNIDAAMAETGITGTKPDGSTRTKNGTAKGSIIGRLWGAEQRFFQQVLTSLSMPTTIAKMKQAIADGHSPVVYLVNTYEASMKRQLAKIAKEGGSYEDVDMTPREDLMEYIRKGFPVQQFEEYRDEKNVIKSRAVTDSQGNPVINRAAVQMREDLLEKIGSMNIFPDSPIDQMLNALGHDNVAEVTGRKSRLKRVGNIEEMQPRSRTIANAEIAQFNNDQRRSLIFNDFGGTGESYDSDKRIKNQRRRVLFIVQPGWQATKVIQALGRVHRSNEANAPHIVLTMTNVRGHRRFISTVARGLDAIGAITKGQRETGSTGLIDAKNNLQNIYGRAAVTSFMEDLVRGQVKDLNDQQGILARMGLTDIVDPMTGGIAETKMPTIEKFLNRIMALEIFEQNQVFDEFYARMTHFVEDAAAKGMLDVGMETYRANGGIKLVDEQVAHVDAHSGAKTYWETFEAKHSVSFLPFTEAKKGRGNKPFLGFYQNRQSGKMWAVSESFTHTLENGTIQQMILLQGPVVGQVQHIPQESILPNGSYSKVEPDIAEAWWKATIAAHPEHRTETLHMVSGALLKIWDRLPVTHARIMRLQTETGERYLGRIILNADVKETKKKLGVGATPVTATPDQIAVKVQTEGAKVTLANGWKIKAAHLQNETRIELTGNELYAHREEIKKAGGFWEVRGSTTRYFLPIGEKAAGAIEAITKNHPVVDIQEKGDDTILQEAQAPYGEPDLFGQEDLAAQLETGTPAKRKSKAEVLDTMQDVGEKIGGARKDRWASRGLTLDDLQDMTGGEEAKFVTKANIWKPDYADMVANGTEPKTAAMVKVIYDGLAAEPKQDDPVTRRTYLGMMIAVKEAYVGARAEADLEAASVSLNAQPYESRRSVTKRKSYHNPFDVDYDVRRKAARLIEEGFPNQQPWTRQYRVREAWSAEELKANRSTTAYEYADRVFRSDDPWKTTFTDREALANLFTQNGIWQVASKGGQIIGWRADKAAAETLAQTTYEASKKTGGEAGDQMPERPHLDELKREGQDYRDGKDVTAEDFRETFGFRGVEFGNWAASDERQKHVNQAYDALSDMADLLGIPNNAISLDGTLGLAFGARGSGKAAAHYESSKLVINITKINGPGALAHEWGHALDHYFGELDKPNPYTSSATGVSGWRDKPSYGDTAPLGHLRPEMQTAFKGLMAALYRTKKDKAAEVRDVELALEQTKAKVAYKIKAIARIEADPKEQKYNKKYWKWAKESLPHDQSRIEYLGNKLADLIEAPEPPGGYGSVESSFYKAAEKLSGPTGDYWKRPTELFARSFEAFVQDKLGRKSQYLVHSTGEGTFASGYKANPYPAGLERTAINAAYDTLFDTMQFKPTEKGMALYEATVPYAALSARAQNELTSLESRQRDLQRSLDQTITEHPESSDRIQSLQESIQDIRDRRAELPLAGAAVWEPQAAYGIRQHGIPASTDPLIHSYRNNAPVKAHQDYTAAKAGDFGAAVRLVRALVNPDTVAEAARRFPGAVFVAPMAQEATGENAIPKALAAHYANAAHGTLDLTITEANKAFHTGADAMGRMIARAVFDGPVTAGARYVLVDDVTTLGGTLAELANHIRRGGGDVVGVITLTNASRTATMNPSRTLIRLLERRYGDEIRSIFGIEPSALTAAEAGYLIGFRDADALRTRAATAKEQRVRRLSAKGLSGPQDHISESQLPYESLFEKHPPYPQRPGEPGKENRRRAQQALGDLDRAGQAVSTATGKVDRQGGPGVRTVALGISPDLIQKGSVDLTGYRVRSAKALAKLAQVLRDPRFETFRIFYLKGDEIVGLEGVTSRLPGIVKVGHIDPAMLRAHMEALGADGFWLLHNHPSGRSNPSVDDLVVTQRLAKEMPGFRGHVVIDSGEYSVIPAGKEFTRANVQTHFIDVGPDRLLTPSIPNPLLGSLIYGKDDVVGIARALKVQTGWVTVLYRAGDGSTRAIQEMPLAMLQNPEAAGRYLAEQGVAYGSQQIITHYKTGDTSVKALSELNRGISKLITSGILFDHVTEHAATGQASSMADLGVRANEGMVLGRNVNAETGVSEWVREPAGQTDTPAFKRWFGDSKVVNEDGTPKVVYHGTGRDFEAFKARPGDQYSGFFFTPRPDHAAEYAGLQGERIIPVYLAIQNPKIVSNKEWYSGNLEDPGTYAEDGYDGMLVKNHEQLNGKSDSWIAFEPTQIKSATGNVGTFDPSNPSILREAAPPYGERRPYELPAMNKMDDLIRLMADKNIDIARLVEAVKQTGVELADEINPVLHEEMYLSRSAQRAKDFVTDEVDPLVKMMKLNHVEIPQVDEYLHARHAKEANEYLKSINPDMEDNDSLSGMDTETARQILDTASPVMERIGAKVDAIIAKTRQAMVDYGLESQKTVDKWAEQYSFYVPLKREGFEDTMGTGQGRSIRGSSVKGRMGSHRGVEFILANIVKDRERIITRGEKMRPVVALAGLLMVHPNKEIATLVKPAPITFTNPDTGLEETLPGDIGDYKTPMLRYLDPKTKTVQFRPDPAYKGRDNVINFRIEGKDYAIVFNEHHERAVQMAQALKDLDVGQLNTVTSMVAPITRYIASINTQYDPIFGIVNFVRDVQFAMLTLGSTPLAGHRLDVLKHTMASMKGIYEDARAVRRAMREGIPLDTLHLSATAQLWERFQHVGGPTGYRDLFKTSKDREIALEHMMDPDWWQKTMVGKVVTVNGLLAKPESFVNEKGLRPLFQWLSDYNTTMENAVRLGVFKTAADMGISDIQAASYAKNITVNFNKKGQVSAQMGALFAFFNANVQGTMRLAETLYEPGKFGVLSSLGKRILVGGVTLGAIQAFALAMAGFGDDEPQEFVKSRNLILPAPGTDKGYVNIPMPLGFNLIPNIGRLMAEALWSGKPMDRAGKAFSAILDAFSPVGGAATPVQFLAPTAVDPLVALSENKSWTGRSIYRENFSSLHPTTGSSRSKDTSTPWARGLANAINYLAGGTQYEPGKVSPSPDAIDYLIGQATGGVGRNISKIFQVGTSFTTGEELPLYKIPLAGRFVGSSTGSAAERDKFYTNLRELNMVEQGIKNRLRDKVPVTDYRKDHPEASLVGMANTSERLVSQLTKQKREMIAKGASPEVVKRKEEQITSYMKRLNERVAQLQAR